MLGTREIAAKVGVHPETVKRWIRQGKVPMPNRDRNGWYIFDGQDVENIVKYATRIHVPDHKQPGLWPNNP